MGGSGAGEAWLEGVRHCVWLGGRAKRTVELAGLRKENTIPGICLTSWKHDEKASCLHRRWAFN